jgi:hypothetical protein
MIYKNKTINTLDNEIWVDCFGYDGIYSVSNLGRVKSENRYVNNGKSQRLVKERILSQAQSKDGRLMVNLSIDNKAKPTQVNQLVYYSFYPEKINDMINNEVFHVNKIVNDNRLINLGYNDIHGKSYKISIELGNVKHLGQARKNVHKYTKENSIIENGIVVKRKCKICNELKDVDYFEYKRNTCLKCRKRTKQSYYQNVKLNRSTSPACC